MRFMEDVERGIEDRYLPVRLQTELEADRWRYLLPARGVVAVVDRHPPEWVGGGWLLDLVSVYHDPDAEHDDPWGLP